MKKYILDAIKRHRVIRITPDFMGKAFPEPKRPTVEDMKTAILSLVASPLVEDRGKIAHVFQQSSKDQLSEFLEDNNLEYWEDYERNEFIFRQKP
jgi:hypothetical protein